MYVIKSEDHGYVASYTDDNIPKGKDCYTQDLQKAMIYDSLSSAKQDAASNEVVIAVRITTVEKLVLDYFEMGSYGGSR